MRVVEQTIHLIFSAVLKDSFLELSGSVMLAFKFMLNLSMKLHILSQPEMYQHRILIIDLKEKLNLWLHFPVDVCFQSCKSYLNKNPMKGQKRVFLKIWILILLAEWFMNVKKYLSGNLIFSLLPVLNCAC